MLPWLEYVLESVQWVCVFVFFPRAVPGACCSQRWSPRFSIFPAVLSSVLWRDYWMDGWMDGRGFRTRLNPGSLWARKLCPLQDYFKSGDAAGVPSAGRGVPSAGELGHGMEGNDRGRGRTHQLAVLLRRWTHRIHDRMKHAVETRLGSAAGPPPDAVERLPELEKFHFEESWGSGVGRSCHKTQRNKTTCPRSHCWSVPPWDLLLSRKLISEHEF